MQKCTLRLQQSSGELCSTNSLSSTVVSTHKSCNCKNEAVTQPNWVHYTVHKLALRLTYTSFHLAVLQEHAYSRQQTQRASFQRFTSNLFNSLLNVLSLTIDDMLCPAQT